MADKKTDMERAVAALVGKATRDTLLWRYYEGDHPLIYSSKRLREVFKQLDAKFVENWCAPVIDAANDRLSLLRWLVDGDAAAQTELNALFMSTELNLDSDEVHLATLVTGEAFVIVWPSEAKIEGEVEVEVEGQGGVDVFYNDPRLVHVEYDGENPKKMAWAAKWWAASDGTARLTMYYRDRLEYYGSGKTKAKDVTKATAFVALDPPQAKNPFGVIPVFHFRRVGRKVISELQSAISPQNAVNKLFADMMVAAEFGAFKQRYVISNADTATLKNAPNEIWSISSGDGLGQGTEVGEFTETNLGGYLTAMDDLARNLAVITRTPKHFIFGHAGGDISGEALIALEAPLNAKCAKYIERFQATWREVAAFMLRVAGTPVQASTVTPVFAPPQTVQPRTRAETRGLNVQAGLPLRTVLRAEGQTDAQLEQMEADRRAEQVAATESLALGLVEQERRRDQDEV